MVQLLPTVKINIRPTVEDKFGYNLVVINNKRYFQTHEDVKDNYARDYQQAIVQHLTIGSTLINSLKDKYLHKFNNPKFIEISALEKFNIDSLISLIKTMLPEGPQYYELNQITDKDLRFQVQEIIREKALLKLKDEVPHGVAVLCDDINLNDKNLNIYAKIIVERESQKGIVIGKGGKMIKWLGTASRKEIENLIKRHINLELNVQVVENWRNSSSFLVKIGYR